MNGVNVNTILQIASIAIMAIGGFWFKMMLNRIETRQSKEVCKILMEQNEKDLGTLKQDINGVGAKIKHV
jgi:hypothetical protein